MDNYSHSLLVARQDIKYYLFCLYLSLLQIQISPILINPKLTLGSSVPNKGSPKTFFQEYKLQIFIQLPHYWDKCFWRKHNSDIRKSLIGVLWS